MLRSVLLLLGLAAASAAQANLYTVSNTNDSGSGSLRQAITSANATASSPSTPHIISINLGGGSGSTHTITLGSELPDVTKPALLLGPSGSTVIVTLPTANRGLWNGLEFTAAAEGSSVYFLTLRGFGVGIRVNAPDFELVGSTLDDNRVAGLHAINATGLRAGNATLAGRNVFTRNGWEGGNSQPRAGAWLQCTQLAPSGSCAVDQDMALLGNLFGVQRNGTTASGNVAYGIVLDAVRGVVVGGEDNAANEIVHNQNSGILARAKALDIAIRENRIVDNGIVATPSRCANDLFANHCDGVTLLDAQGATFEPQASDGSLVIADNRENGIALRGGVGQHVIRRSTIGAVYDVTGLPLVAGNGEHGVLIDAAPNNEFGVEQSSVHANLIFANGGDGIRVQGAAAVNNRFHRNLISGNGGAGIALNSGGNPGAPIPIIDAVTPQVSGSVSGSGPGVVSIYADGDGEGAHYLGDAVLSGTSFSLPLDLSDYAGMDITAVATRGQVSSRFATPVSVPVPAGQAVVQVTRNGNGGVSSAPQGIACGEDCGQAWPLGTIVTLSGTGAPGWAVSRWSGGCSGFAATCQFVVQANATVEARFYEQGRNDYPAVFTIDGQGEVRFDGTSTVVCAAPHCDVTGLPFGVPRTFAAVPDAGWQFLGWGDQCSGTGTCTLTITASGPRYAKAIFAPAGTRRLTVITNGAGSVTSAPAGIDCPGTCAFDFANGSNVTLTPSPQPGWQFEGWTGACAGTGACVVSMSVAREVGATFGPGAGTQTLSVSVTGNGSVTSAPGSIDCPGNCSGNFPTGSQVTLVPTADPGWTFSGWGGSCSGTGSCVVTMSQARNVTATFVAVPVTHTLTVSRSGSGSITSTPAGISCPGTCSSVYSAGTQVVLTRSADPGWSFVGWGGACSGSAPTCTVTMNADVSVQATFEQATNPDDAIFASSFEDSE